MSQGNRGSPVASNKHGVVSLAGGNEKGALFSFHSADLNNFDLGAHSQATRDNEERERMLHNMKFVRSTGGTAFLNRDGQLVTDGPNGTASGNGGGEKELTEAMKYLRRSVGAPAQPPVPLEPVVPEFEGAPPRVPF